MLDRYQLWASLAQSAASLAWPGAFVFAIWLFRRELAKLFPLLRLKYKDFDISFRLDEAEREAARLPVARTEDGSAPTAEELSRFERLAEISPRGAIVELRSELEDTIKKVALANGVDVHSTKSLLHMTRLLRSHKIIAPQTSALLDDLRVIGNNAAHSIDDSQFKKEDALRYRKLVDQVIQQLQSDPQPTTANSG